MHRILGACVLSILVACGGGGSGGTDAGDDPGKADVPTVPDEGVPDTPTPPDEGAPDTAPPADPGLPDEGGDDLPEVPDPGVPDVPVLPDEGPDGLAPLTVAVAPADGDRGVSVIAPVTVTLSHPVTSPAGDATPSLAWARGFNEASTSGIDVAGQLAVLGKTVTFTPDAPLAPGTTYRFRLSGLATAAGAVPPVVVFFRTWENPVASQVSWDAADRIRQYTVYDYADGVPVGNRSFGGPGSDGLWQNGDDAQSGRTAFEAPEQGHWTRLLAYNAPGADAQWGTDDDTLAYHQFRTFDENGQNILYDSYSGLGADGVPFSGDEPYGFRQQKTFDGRGLLVRSFQPGGPGPDAAWFTGDDTAPGYSVTEYDEAGRRTRGLSMGRGPDDLFFTEDDLMGGYTAYALLPDGRLDRYTEIEDPGADGTWFTADDADRWPTVYTYDSRGLVETEAWYDGAGVMGGYTEFDHDAAGRMTAQRRYDAGPDGTFRTADDFVQVLWTYRLP